MKVLTPTETQRYLSLLKRDVFRTTTRWPQFDLLLSDVAELAKVTGGASRVISLERNLLYGGRSLIRPFFQHCEFVAVEMSPPTNAGHGSYNEGLLSNILSEFGEDIFECEQASIKPDCCLADSGLASADVVIIPNLLHHVRSLPEFFVNVSEILNPKGTGYLFDSTLREWHQVPDDFYRLTPWALEEELRRVGCRIRDVDTTGGPFDAILYCWEQALEYLPDQERSAWKGWLEAEHGPALRVLSERHSVNLVRMNSAFPTAYSILFEKCT